LIFDRLITQLSVRLDKRTLHVAVTENGKKEQFYYAAIVHKYT